MMRTARGNREFTEQEASVLWATAQLPSTPHTARFLRMEVAAVRRALERVYDKTGCLDRTQLLAWCRERDII